MKKTLIALLTLGCMVTVSNAASANDNIITDTFTISSTKPTGGEGTERAYYVLDAPEPYNMMESLYQNGGTLTISFDFNYAGGTTADYQTFFHIGEGGRGITIAANGAQALIFSQPHSNGMYDGTYELKGHPFQTGNNSVTFTLTSTETEGAFTSSITLNGTTYDMHGMDWTTMNWSSSQAQREKYSVGCMAPGYSSKTLETVTLGASGITMTHTYLQTPEPATATLSLLALAGLAARRRRH